MEWLAIRVVNRRIALAIVLAVVTLALVAGYKASQLQHEDDLLAFLPQDNADVELFHAINRRFAITDVAMVGIEVEDPFDPTFLETLRRVSRELDAISHINHVTSLTTVADFTADEMRGGIITAPLVDAIPSNAVERAALRTKVMSRDHIVGHLISEDAAAVVVYCYLTYGADPKKVASQIRSIVSDAFPGLQKYWGGGPFISTYIYETTQNDLRQLTPWAVLAIILIMALAFRDLIGTCVALLSTAIGIVFALGLMATFDVRFNIVLGAMPVILFAVGSAYGVHILARYYALAENRQPLDALRDAVSETGPVVVAAGLTTAVSLLSFVCMDIQPLRTFGLFTAIGVLSCLVLAVTFIPAVVSLTGMRRRASSSTLGSAVSSRLAGFAHAHRGKVIASLVVVAITAAFFVGRIDTGVDYATFFSPDSPPDRAEKFMTRHFGGSQFVQVHIRGDMGDPHVLREVRRMADRVSLLPEVSTVIHAGIVLAQSNNAMAGQLRIPDTGAQARLLYTFIDDPAMTQLASPDRTEGVLHIKLRVNRADATRMALEKIEKVIDHELVGRFNVVDGSSDAGQRRLRDIVAWRILALVNSYDATLPGIGKARLNTQLAWSPAQLEQTPVASKLARFFRSEENPIELPDAAVVTALASALAAAGPDLGDAQRFDIIGRALPSKADDLIVEDLDFATAAVIDNLWRSQRAAQRSVALIEKLEIRPPSGSKGERFTRAIETALLDLDSPTALVSADNNGAVGTTGMQVNGLPVLHRGLSISVTRNQLLSLAFALALILTILSLMFRSILVGLLISAPTMLTLLIIYGGMGLLGVNLDVGTSMLASLVLGAGVDYAVHLVAAWNASADEPLGAGATRAAALAGPAIWTNAIMIAVGFAVLTLGHARPLQNVGGLTAAAMITAALATFLAVPALARRRSYPLAGREQKVDETRETAAADATASAQIGD